MKRSKSKGAQRVPGSDNISDCVASPKWEILCVNTDRNRAGRITAHKEKDRSGFRDKGVMHYIGWEEVRKSKDHKEIGEKTGKAAKTAGT